MSGVIDRKYVSYKDAARYSGLSASTLRKLVKDGSLPMYRVRRRALLSLDALREMIESAMESACAAK